MSQRGINKVILIGNLGKDPEVRYMPNGKAAASFSLATSESWKDKQSGEQKELTEWHRVVAYEKLAEIIGEYVKKGSKIYIEGKLRTRKWQDKDGQEKYMTEIIADEMQMLDGKSVVAENSPNESKPVGSVQQSMNDFNDDIPF